MARHSYERARWNRREARRRVSIGGWWVSYRYWERHQNQEEKWKAVVRGTHERLNESVHGCLSEATRKYRKLWRRQAHEICRLHECGAHEAAENLDPQPRRLGVMWDIW